MASCCLFCSPSAEDEEWWRKAKKEIEREVRRSAPFEELAARAQLVELEEVLAGIGTPWARERVREVTNVRVDDSREVFAVMRSAIVAARELAGLLSHRASLIRDREADKRQKKVSSGLRQLRVETRRKGVCEKLGWDDEGLVLRRLARHDKLLDAIEVLDAASARRTGYKPLIALVARRQGRTLSLPKDSADAWLVAALSDPSCYERALELEPSAAARIGYGKRLAPDLAAREFKLAIDLEPANAAAFNYLGTVLEGEAAERAFQRAIEIDPTYGSPHNNYGVLLGDDDEAAAEREFRAAIALDASPSARNNYGIFLCPVDPDAAERQFLLAEGYSPAHANYGLLLERRGEHDAAEIQFKLAIDCDPSNADAHSNYGAFLCGIRGDVENGRREFEMALEVDPSHRPAQDNLRRLLLKSKSRVE